MTLACGGDPPPSADSCLAPSKVDPAAPVTRLGVHLLAGGSHLFEGVEARSENGATFKPTKARFYVSQLALIGEGGSRVAADLGAEPRGRLRASAPARRGLGHVLELEPRPRVPEVRRAGPGRIDGASGPQIVADFNRLLVSPQGASRPDLTNPAERRVHGGSLADALAENLRGSGFLTLVSGGH